MAIRSLDRSAGLGNATQQAGQPSPADTFTAKAAGKAWFVKAEMVRPLGGRLVRGHVALREPRLEITVRHGGRSAAEALLVALELDGHVNEQRPIPHGLRTRR